MFETSAVLARPNVSRQRRVALAVTSVAVHSVAITGAIFFTVWNVELPDRAPNQIAAYQFMRQVPIPPGGSPPAEQPARPAQTATRPAQQVAPDSTPREVKPAETSNVSKSDAVTGVPDDGSSSTLAQGDGTGPGDEIGSGVGTRIGDGVGEGDGKEPVPERYAVGGNVKAPVITHRVDPAYPETLRAVRLRGSATIECVIGTDGRPTEIKVIRASHVLFGASAAAAVERWRFRPGTLNGRTVETILSLHVEFSLN